MLGSTLHPLDMLARFFSGFLLFFASLGPAETEPPTLLAARELLAQVRPEHTSYKHKEPVVRWSRDPAEPAWCHTDCSGLIIALLQHCDARIDDAALKRWFQARRPTARRFYDAIAAERGFRRIARIGDIVAGDLIAMKYPPGGTDTGHIMLVAAAPQSVAASEPVIPGTAQWLVTIIDETGSGHGAKDTRREANGKFRGGLGQGEFRLYTHADGTLAGYAWSAHPRSKFHGVDSGRVIAVGRLLPDFRP